MTDARRRRFSRGAPTPIRLTDDDHTIIETSTGVMNDLHEHLGQLVAYSRMIGVVPPWSK